MSISNEMLSKLAKFDTPTICNVIELFGVQPRCVGYMDSRIRAEFPELPPMVGLASTATFRSAAPPQGGDSYAGLEQQLENMASLSASAVIVFQDLDDPPVGATFGEVMCSVYKAYGGAGLITSGAGRDLQQVNAIRFPVFTSGTICSHAYTHIVDVGRPVRVGGLVVRSGDLLHGDANGVTAIPLEVADEVADVAAELIAIEKRVLDALQSPSVKTIADWSKNQKLLRDEVSKLRQRVSRTKYHLA
jgi:4-hydroxy-4-methyl-2-oxoglutarate aldolase